MKKLYLVITTILLSNIAISQNFSLVIGTPFDGVSKGTVTFADIDNDNDQDVLITGINNTSFQIITKLYTNDGNGNYSLVNGTSFTPVMNSSVAFADIDNDNDLDLLITGDTSASQVSSKLYTNDGFGTFTHVPGTPFLDVSRSSIAFADVDNDNDQDVLITGERGNGQRISKLYKNDGTGIFTLATSGASFTGVRSSSVAFADIDNDNDQDVLITGWNSSNIPTARLYLNDSLGNFTYDFTAPFTGVNVGSVAFEDIDNDNDMDVLISGSNSGVYSKFYTNDGSGNFTLVSGTTVDGVQYGAVKFADIDNDNDKDLLIIGENNSLQRITKLYNNDGNGNFSFITGMPFDVATEASAAFADTDNDGSIDLLITGSNNSSNQSIAKLYRNQSISTDLETQNNLFQNVSITPNPSNGPIKIDLNNLKDVSIKIFNSSGQLIFSEKDISTKYYHYTLNKSTGIYFVEITSQNETTLYPIIKR